MNEVYQQLLEESARAAGITLKKRGDTYLALFDDNPTWIHWNPLEDNGDAFRLACILKIDTRHEDDCVWAEHSTMLESAEDDAVLTLLDNNREKELRRAIVCAAAKKASKGTKTFARTNVTWGSIQPAEPNPEDAERLAHQLVADRQHLQAAEGREQALMAHITQLRKGIYLAEGWYQADSEGNQGDASEWLRQLGNWLGEHASDDLPVAMMPEKLADQGADIGLNDVAKQKDRDHESTS